MFSASHCSPSTLRLRLDLAEGATAWLIKLIAELQSTETASPTHPMKKEQELSQH